MPLVTRQANQGRFFVTATEPPDWLDGDLWSDTTANLLKLNVAGSPVTIGEGEISSRQEIALLSNDTTTSTSYEISTVLLTLADRSGGSAYCVATLGVTNDNTANTTTVVFFDDAATLSGDQVESPTANSKSMPVPLVAAVALDGSVIAVFFKVSAGTGTLYGTSASVESKMAVFEMGI